MALLLCCLIPGLAASAGEVVVLTSFPKELFESYRTAFEKVHPGVTVVVKSKQTSAMVAYVKETRANPDADLVWASATDAFAVLKGEGLLSSHALPAGIAERIPQAIGPYPVHDPEGHYFGFALSGYGMMWNKPYLNAYGIEPPREWVDLARPMYHGHVSMSAPSRSGTTHLMVESILQGYGWNEGWRILLGICGNMASITERSFGVPQGVNNGEFGIGMVIDFFALSSMASEFPVDFRYPSLTPITPASIGLVKGGPNEENGEKFIHFVLGEAGQRLLFGPGISRLPVVPELYVDAPEGFPNPFAMEMSGAKFDIAVSEGRYGLMNALFDQVVTFRLDELKAAWGAIHEAESALAEAKSAGRNVSGGEKLLAQAKALVSTVPVTEAQTVDADFAGHFRKESTELQARYETEWDAQAKADYAKARQMAARAAE